MRSSSAGFRYLILKRQPHQTCISRVAIVFNSSGLSLPTSTVTPRFTNRLPNMQLGSKEKVKESRLHYAKKTTLRCLLTILTSTPFRIFLDNSCLSSHEWTKSIRNCRT